MLKIAIAISAYGAFWSLVYTIDCISTLSGGYGAYRDGVRPLRGEIGF